MNRPITANAIDMDTRGWTSSTDADVERVVRRAIRHSRTVRIVRVALPIGVIVGLIGIVTFTYFNPMRMLDAVPSVGKLAVQGSKITMELPRIAGFTRDSRAYELTAETAVQDISDPDTIELKSLRAKMELQDRDVVEIAASSGVYNSKGDKLQLRDQILVKSAHGYLGRLREASVDMKGGKVVSEQPVEITMPTGKLTANRLEIIDSGELIRFDRGVVLTIDGDKVQMGQGAAQ